MVQVKDIEKSSPELQALIESEVKQLLKVSKLHLFVVFHENRATGREACWPNGYFSLFRIEQSGFKPWLGHCVV